MKINEWEVNNESCLTGESEIGQIFNLPSVFHRSTVVTTGLLQLSYLKKGNNAAEEGKFKGN